MDLGREDRDDGSVGANRARVTVPQWISVARTETTPFRGGQDTPGVRAAMDLGREDRDDGRSAAAGVPVSLAAMDLGREDRDDEFLLSLAETQSIAAMDLGREDRDDPAPNGVAPAGRSAAMDLGREDRDDQYEAIAVAKAECRNGSRSRGPRRRRSRLFGSWCSVAAMDLGREDRDDVDSPRGCVQP